MRRRDFFAVIAGATALRPLSGAAQQKAMPVIGILSTRWPNPNPNSIPGPLSEGLSETGYVVGQTVVFERRWAEGRYDRLPALAVELVGHNVDLIVTFGGTPPA